MLDKQKIARTAEELAQKGQFDKAIRELQRLVQEDPSDDFVWLKLGDLFVKKGEPRQGALFYLKAAELYSVQSPEKAIKVFQAVLSLDPTQIQCHQRLAALYYAAGKPRDAMEQLEPYATFFENQKKFPEAIQVRQRMLDLLPDYLPVRIKLAELFNHIENQEEAVLEFAKVAKQLKQMGRVDDYLKVVERLLFLQPDNKEHLFVAAKTYLAQKKPKEALGKLQGLFVLNPRNIDVLDLLSETFLLLGQKDKAVRVLKEISRQKPEMKAAIFKRILAIDPDEQDAKNFLQPPPAPPAARMMPPAPPVPGLSLVGIPSLPSQVAKLPVPKDLPAQDLETEAKITKRLAEAQLYIKFGLQEKARNHLQEALELNPDHHELLISLKNLYIGLADYQEAIPILLKLCKESQEEEAKTFLKQLLSLNPRHEEAQKLYQQLGGEVEVEVEPEILDESDIIEEKVFLEEVSELVEQIEVQEEAKEEQHIKKRSPSRPGSTMIQMSPFYEVAEVIEPEERQEEFQALPEEDDFTQLHPNRTFQENDALGAGAVLYDPEEFISEVTSKTDPNALRQVMSKKAPERNPTIQSQFDPSLFGAAVVSDIEDSLAEADFFVQQGLLEDAKVLLEDLRRVYPQDQRIQQKQLELSNKNSPRQNAVTTLDASFDSTTDAQPGSGSPFELGLAYRDRGMIDEAIQEFQNLLGSGIGDAICYHLIGVCHSDKGRYREAIDAFKRALQAGGLSFEDELGVYYALGATHEAIGDHTESIYYYQRVYQRNSRFRDVAIRLQQLQNLSRVPQERESGASPLPIRQENDLPQAVAGSQDDDDRYS